MSSFSTDDLETCLLRGLLGPRLGASVLAFVGLSPMSACWVCPVVSTPVLSGRAADGVCDTFLMVGDACVVGAEKYL